MRCRLPSVTRSSTAPRCCIIEGKEKRSFDGKKTDLLRLRITYGDLKVSIPVEKADEIGLRDVINDEEVEEVSRSFARRSPHADQLVAAVQEPRREAQERRHLPVAEVVRNLSLRDADKGLSAGEKRMLARARQISSPS